MIFGTLHPESMQNMQAQGQKWKKIYAKTQWSQQKVHLTKIALLKFDHKAKIILNRNRKLINSFFILYIFSKLQR